MTPDQIRQIAEEYAHKQWGKPVSHTTSELASVLKDFLQYFTERYCVVERSKVVELYECFSQNIQASRKLGLTHAEDIAKGSCATMRDIFGSETFNKKEV